MEELEDEGRKEGRKEGRRRVSGYTLVLNKASYDTVVSFARFSPMIYDRIHKSSHHLPRTTCPLSFYLLFGTIILL